MALLCGLCKSHFCMKKKAGLWDTIQVHMQNSDSFTDMIFRLVQSLPKDVLNKIAMLLWAIWWTINFEGILHCVGLDMCLWDELNQFILVRTINFEVILQPVEADAMALCKAMSWVHDRLFFNPIVKLSLMVIILIVQHNQNQKWVLLLWIIQPRHGIPNPTKSGSKISSL